jgi:hypothetical protein
MNTAKIEGKMAFDVIDHASGVQLDDKGCMVLRRD